MQTNLMYNSVNYPRELPDSAISSELPVQRVYSHAFSKHFRRVGALACAVWVLILWVSPSAFSLWAASSCSASSCCRSRNVSCCKRRHNAVGPQVSSDSCGSSCRGCGNFLQTDTAPCLPGGVAFHVHIESNASRVIRRAPAIRAAWDAAKFQRPPPPC